MHSYIHTYIHSCIHTYIHTYIHAYIHTYIRTYMNVCMHDVCGIEAFHLSVSNELEQIIKHPTCVPDRLDHAANILDLFFTFNPQNYTYTVSSPLRFSDHCTGPVTSYFTPPLPIPPTQHYLWHFENARHADMSNFLLDFPWNDYCFWTRDPDLVAIAVGEVVDLGMRSYIPYSLITFSPSNPWLDRACSSAISDREGAHRSYQASPSELTHATFISARKCCSAKILRAYLSFHKGKLISSTLLLLKNVSGPYPKKQSSTTFVTPAFPHFFALVIKPISLLLTFLPILLSAIPMLLILLLNPSLTLYPPSSSLLVKFSKCFVHKKQISEGIC